MFVIDEAEGRRRVRLARRLREMPATAEALADGAITVAHVERLARAATPERGELFARDEALLVDQARELTFAQWQRAVAYWEQLADPDGVEANSAAAEEQRRLHVSQTLDGSWVLDGQADAIRGGIVADVLARIDDELFADDWAQAKALHGDDTRVEHLARTPAQRRFDALVEMATRAASTPADAKRPRPLFTVLVDYPTLAGRVCELADGTVVTPGALAGWLTEADIERVVFDGASRVLDVGVKQRLFTGATRRAVEVRDRECTHDYCDEPAERCDVDHTHPHAAGGFTEQTNGRLRCPHHHEGRRTTRPPPDHDP